jgi:hypothetical protein
LFLRGVPLAQLLAPPVEDARVDGELIADNRAAAVALGVFDAFDLRRQLATPQPSGDALRDNDGEVMMLPGCVP